MHLLLKYTFCKGSSNSGILSSKCFVICGARLTVKFFDQVIIFSMSLNACHQNRHKGKNRKSLAGKTAGKIKKTDSIPGVIHLVVAQILIKIHAGIDARNTFISRMQGTCTPKIKIGSFMGLQISIPKEAVFQLVYVICKDYTRKKQRSSTCTFRRPILVSSLHVIKLISSILVVEFGIEVRGNYSQVEIEKPVCFR